MVIADTYTFDLLKHEQNLARVLEIMNTRAGGFIDLGLIDSEGDHVAYVGPYSLKGINFYQQPWFIEVENKGAHISDVFLGFRKIPHIIIAIRRQENGRGWILRATIDSDVFHSLIRAGQVGKTGDAFIVNKEGIYQTLPRFGGDILTKSNIDTSLFGEGVTVVERRTEQGNTRLEAGAWLKNNSWLLIISQDPSEEMIRLFQTRNMELAIGVLGVLAIVLTTVLTTRVTVKRLQAADKRMN